jgi:hypothetical protein
VYDSHFRLSARGILVTNDAAKNPTGEEFSYRLNLSRPLGGAPVEDLVDDMAADISAYHARVTTGVNSRNVLTEVKLAKIRPDGLYDGNAAVRFVNIPGGANAVFHPPQVALAVSLLTGVRGPSRRGRIFLPGPAFQLTAEFMISENDAAGCALSTAQLLRDLNNAPGADPANSPKVTIASLKGFNTDVTQVRVGRVLDTIRSRRTSLPERYVPAVVV